MKLIRKYHLTFGDKKFSYILNIKSLLLDKTVTESDKCFIIYLASYRSLYDYKLYGITALPLDIAEKLVDINLLKYNKLYKIDENNLILINN